MKIFGFEIKILPSLSSWEGYLVNEELLRRQMLLIADNKRKSIVPLFDPQQFDESSSKDGERIILC